MIFRSFATAFQFPILAVAKPFSRGQAIIILSVSNSSNVSQNKASVRREVIVLHTEKPFHQTKIPPSRQARVSAQDSDGYTWFHRRVLTWATIQFLPPPPRQRPTIGPIPPLTRKAAKALFFHESKMPGLILNSFFPVHVYDPHFAYLCHLARTIAKICLPAPRLEQMDPSYRCLLRCLHRPSQKILLSILPPDEPPSDNSHLDPLRFSLSAHLPPLTIRDVSHSSPTNVA